MKTAFLGVLLFFLAGSVDAQIVAKLYYDREWRLTKIDSAAYFRTSVFDTINRVFAGEVRDFTRDGKLVMTGIYKDGKKNGLFQIRDKNGTTTSVGLYENGFRTGVWKYFYSSGELMSEIEFNADRVSNVISCYDSAGLRILEDGTGILLEEYEEPGMSQMLVNQGALKKLVKVGEWTCRLKDGTLLYAEKYNKTGFVSGKAFNLAGNGAYHQPAENHLLPHYKFFRTETFVLATNGTLDDYPYLKRKVKPQTTRKIVIDSLSGEIFTVVEESAAPPGGMAAFYKFIAEHIRYPQDARKKGIQGRVFVEFIIYEDGVLADFKVIKGIGAGCDDEAVRVLEEYAIAFEWLPGRQRGKPVKQRYVLPIIFKIG